MQTSVNLQDPFSYSIYIILIVAVLAISIFVYLIIALLKKKLPIDEVQIKKVEPKNVEYIKQNYIKRLNEIEYKLKNNKISIRSAYQSMSMLIRYFVYEVTNIKVQNYTLRDIEKLNMPILYELIQEYYAPEFAEHSLGNIQVSLERTRKVIEKWN